MQMKTILITGATDGIGLETARRLAGEGHRILLHGRSPAKLDAAARAIGGTTETHQADLSRLDEVAALADAVAVGHEHIDVLINNAGVFKTAQPLTPEGLDVRFVVNSLAPTLLARKLLSRIPATGRIINLSSAAQAPVNLAALAGEVRLDDMEAYAQSKLVLTMVSQTMGQALPDGPVVVSVNPGSLLASKMVTEGFGIAGNDLSIGADCLREAALGKAFADRSGDYFDNDNGRFASPHRDAADPEKTNAVIEAVDAVLAPWFAA